MGLFDANPNIVRFEYRYRTPGEKKKAPYYISLYYYKLPNNNSVAALVSQDCFGILEILLTSITPWKCLYVCFFLYRSGLDIM